MTPNTHGSTVTATVNLTSDNTDSIVDHKSRFGKPVTEPNLAENIKGKSCLYKLCSKQDCPNCKSEKIIFILQISDQLHRHNKMHCKISTALISGFHLNCHS